MSFHIIQSQSYKEAEDSIVWLAMYARFIQYDERPFFGLAYDNMNKSGCAIWMQYQRDMVQFYLAEAQREVENELGYFVSPQWVAESSEDAFYRDNQPLISRLVRARWKYVIEGGIKATTLLSSGETVDYSPGGIDTDPATIGPVALASQIDADEIHVYHPGTQIEIPPSSIVVSTAAPWTVTIRIPWARLVKYTDQNNPESGWNYEDVAITGPYEQTVDVYRVYNDPSTQATLVKENCCPNGCVESTTTGCIKVLDKKLGHLQVTPATYSSGAWSITCPTCSAYTHVRLNYRAGLESLDKRLVDVIMRLANAKMPEAPCNCDMPKALWERDRAIPEITLPGMERNPFGMTSGAWAAWKYVNQMAVVTGKVL